MQQRHVGVDLYLSTLDFLDRPEHELAEVTTLLLQEDLVYALIVHEFVVPGEAQELAVEEVLQADLLVEL